MATTRFLWALFLTNLKAVTALRGSFLLSMTFMALNNATFFVFWWVLLGRVGHLRGWYLADVELLFGISAAGFGLMQATAGGAVHLSRFIADGALEPLLVQPKSTLAYALGCRAQASGFGDLLSGLVFIGMSGHLSWYSAPRVALCVLSSTVAFTASCVIMFSLAFWVQKTHQLSRQLLDILITFSLYPEPLFGGALRLALFTVLPAGFVGYLPVRVVQAPSWVDVSGLVIGAGVYLVVAVVAFELGLRRYASGSRFSTFG